VLFIVVDIDCSCLRHTCVLLLMILTVNSVLSVATRDDLCSLQLTDRSSQDLHTETRQLFLVWHEFACS